MLYWSTIDSILYGAQGYIAISSYPFGREQWRSKDVQKGIPFRYTLRYTELFHV